MIRRYLTSHVGRKVLMALTGLLLIGFLVSHVIGNLLIFVSPETFNNYSHALVSNPLIIVAELGLVALFVAHAASGIAVSLKNRAARPERYAVNRSAKGASRQTWASRSMALSGLALIFIPLHIWDFKYGTVYASIGQPEVRDLYRLVVEELSETNHFIFYVVAMLMVGFHLWHAFGSAFESLGIRYRCGLRCTGRLLAVAITSGFIIVPIMIYLRGGVL